MIARSLATGSRVLLLDEPTANLDIDHLIETLTLLRALADDLVTSVFGVRVERLAAGSGRSTLVFHRGRRQEVREGGSGYGYGRVANKPVTMRPPLPE